MEQVRVNLSLEKEVWIKFGEYVPKRKKSEIVNELLKREIKKMNWRKKEAELAAAFKEAAGDETRSALCAEWAHLDIEGWNG